MKKILILFVVFSQTIQAQKYFTRTGKTEFKASVEAFEPVEAINNSSTAIINTTDGRVAVQLFMTAFKFKVALMQEHFNENYMDSDKYPKAIFKGKLNGFSMENLNQEKEFDLQGDITIKGITKTIQSKAKVIAKDGKLILKTMFSVKPQDFNIKIPGIVRKKIAENINVIVDYELAEKK